MRGALIGCGFFALNQLRAWRDMPGVEIVALCDTSRERLASFAEHCPGAATFTDAQAMLAQVALDFVDIVTPTGAHKPLVLLAAAAGVQVICQKPFAATLIEARTMIKACQAANVSLTVHENWRWQPPLRAAIEQVRGGGIGTPFFGRVSFRSGFDVYRLQPYLAQTPRFIIEDLGVHLLDVARALFGDVARLSCHTRRVNPAIQGEDTATVLLHHDGGASCVVDMSYATRLAVDPFPQTLLEVDGSEGSLRLLTGGRLQLHRGGKLEEVAVDALAPAWSEAPWTPIQASVAALQNAWLQGRRETHGEDNYNTQALVEAAYESAASATQVTPKRYGASTIAGKPGSYEPA
jgi:predicted dehydrogenase